MQVRAHRAPDCATALSSCNACLACLLSGQPQAGAVSAHEPALNWCGQAHDAPRAQDRSAQPTVAAASSPAGAWSLAVAEQDQASSAREWAAAVAGSARGCPCAL